MYTLVKLYGKAGVRGRDRLHSCAFMWTRVMNVHEYTSTPRLMARSLNSRPYIDCITLHADLRPTENCSDNSSLLKYIKGAVGRSTSSKGNNSTIYALRPT